MAEVQVVVGLLLAVAVLAGASLRTGVPYPVALVLGGLAIGVLPGVPAPELDPDVVFFVFLPPLLYTAAYGSSVFELRSYAREIGLLAVGLVLLTMVAVALVAHVAAGLGWAPAFVLGALLAPTDPVSATAVLRRLGVRGSSGTILEGESLVNDASGLTAYKLAIAALGAGLGTPLEVGGRLVLTVAGGVAIGLLAGWASGWLRRFVRDPSLDVTLSLVTPFVAYVPADAAGASGVLAVVVAGVYAGTHSLDHVEPGLRLRNTGFWDSVWFLLNGLLFLLIGLQLPQVLERIPDGELPSLVGEAAAVATVMVLVRMAWMAGVPALYAAFRPLGVRAVRTRRSERTVIGWSGMRGGVSLAAALAIPMDPARDRLLFLAYVVVVVTLVLPGLTLQPLVRRLGLAGDPDAERAEDVTARLRITRAALERLAEAASGDAPPTDAVLDRLRATYEARVRRLEAREDPEGDLDAESAAEVRAAASLQVAMIEAERDELRAMRRERTVPLDVLQEVERELDLDESRVRARVRL